MADRASQNASRELAQVYEKHGFALYRRCLSLLRNEAEAQDVVHECLTEYWQKRSLFQRRASLFSFLYRIATRRCIDRLRRTTRFPSVQGDDSNLGQTASSAGDTERAQLLAQLTVGLSDDILMVAAMAYVDGLTQEEIAQALSLSRRTVGKRLSRFKSHSLGRAAELGVEAV